MAFRMPDVQVLVKASFERARRKMMIHKGVILDSYQMAEPISDVVPGHEANEMEFGDFKRDDFTVLFIDIRNSTDRAHNIGPENTFLTHHAFFPGVAYTINEYGGYVLDFMGDGAMAFFGGERSGMSQERAAKQAGLCGMQLLSVVDEVVNPVLRNGGIPWGLDCGVGIDHGSVIVTKIGTDPTHDIKAIGECINDASKLSKGINDVVVGERVKEMWPSSQGGKMRFSKHPKMNGYRLWSIK